MRLYVAAVHQTALFVVRASTVTSHEKGLILNILRQYMMYQDFRYTSTHAQSVPGPLFSEGLGTKLRRHHQHSTCCTNALGNGRRLPSQVATCVYRAYHTIAVELAPPDNVSKVFYTTNSMQLIMMSLDLDETETWNGNAT